MEWRKISEGCWSAVSASGTQWDIVKRDEGRYGCVVANWDKPDWYARTLEEAKALCEEIDARPSIPPEEWIPWPPADAAEYLDGPPPRYESELSEREREHFRQARERGLGREDGGDAPGGA